MKTEDASARFEVLAGVLLVSCWCPAGPRQTHSAQVSPGFNQILSLDLLYVNTSHAGFVVFSSPYGSDVDKAGHLYLGGAFPGNDAERSADERPAVNNYTGGKTLRRYFQITVECN